MFAATGALAASRKQMDFVGFLFLACLTGLGGGTVRDAILGLAPVFWLDSSRFLAVCLLVAALVYATAERLESRYRLLLWFDAVGLSVYSVVGAQVGLSAGAPIAGAIATGVMTATLGGILRDVIAGEPTVLMRREIYVTAALAGATVHVALVTAGLSTPICAAIAAATAFSIRGGALLFEWSLPGYRHRAGRRVGEDPEDGNRRS